MKAASKGENAVPGTIERSSEIRRSSLHVMQEWDLPQWELQSSATELKMTGLISKFQIPP